MKKNIPLSFILAGGRGGRLNPLTKSRAKPAVPFAGNYRVVDFVLSNHYHSGIRKILVLTQYQSESLHRHIRRGWYGRFGLGEDQFIQTLPAMQTYRNTGDGWYVGTAAAINQNTRYIEREKPNIVNIFGADHIYLMDISKMNNFHLKKDADLTISAITVPKELAANNYGVLVVDENWQVKGFEEKAKNPTTIPGNDDLCLASMGNYAFKPEVVLEELAKDSNKKFTNDKEEVLNHPEEYSTYDFGYDIIPSMLRENKKIFSYKFGTDLVPGADEKERGFWKDIGNIDQFYQANMQIRSISPLLDIYNEDWKILTYIQEPEPSKIVGAEAKCIESLLSNGVIISHATIDKSIVSYSSKVKEGAIVQNSILMGYNNIERGAIIKNAIIDRNVIVPAEETVGVDKEKDNNRGFTISESGITVVPKGYVFEKK